MPLARTLRFQAMDWLWGSADKTQRARPCEQDLRMSGLHELRGGHRSTTPQHAVWVPTIQVNRSFVARPLWQDLCGKPQSSECRRVALNPHRNNGITTVNHKTQCRSGPGSSMHVIITCVTYSRPLQARSSTMIKPLQ